MPLLRVKFADCLCGQASALSGCVKSERRRKRAQNAAAVVVFNTPVQSPRDRAVRSWRVSPPTPMRDPSPSRRLAARLAPVPARVLTRVLRLVLILALGAWPTAAVAFTIIVTENEIPPVPNSVLQLARELGYFQRAGVHVDFLPTTGTPLAVAALLAREGDMANITIDALVAMARQRQTGFRAVSAPAKPIPYVLVSKSDIASIKDLAGRTFGIGQAGTLGRRPDRASAGGGRRRQIDRHGGHRPAGRPPQDTGQRPHRRHDGFDRHLGHAAGQERPQDTGRPRRLRCRGAADRESERGLARNPAHEARRTRQGHARADAAVT